MVMMMMIIPTTLTRFIYLISHLVEFLVVSTEYRIQSRNPPCQPARGLSPPDLELHSPTPCIPS